MNSEKIAEKLYNLLSNSYSPYSKFRVSAIAKVGDKYYYGVNIENSAFGLTMCAERNAIFSAISNGETKIDEIYLMTSGTEDNCTPCGSCRQVMSEFMKPDALVHVYNINKKERTYMLKELIPFAFNKEAYESGKK